MWRHWRAFGKQYQHFKHNTILINKTCKSYSAIQMCWSRFVLVSGFDVSLFWPSSDSICVVLFEKSKNMYLNIPLWYVQRWVMYSGLCPSVPPPNKSEKRGMSGVCTCSECRHRCAFNHFKLQPTDGYLLVQWVTAPPAVIEHEAVFPPRFDRCQTVQ